MDIQVFNAFRQASLHADKIATKGDLKELESSLIKWIVGTLIASVGVMTGLMALLLKAVGN